MKERLLTLLLKGFAVMPLQMLYLLADFLFLNIYYVAGYRKKVVRQNLKESFPEKTPEEIKKIERGYYRFLADTIVETLKLLHISDKEMKKRVEVSNPEIVNDSLARKRNVVLLMGHYCNWEWAQEISRYFLKDSYHGSIYHPMSNKTWDAVFQNLRSRWGAHIVPQRNAVRTLLDKNNFPWVFGFIADARPLSKKEGDVTEFLNHETLFIYGPEVIGKKTGADFFYLEMTRKKRGKYRITFYHLNGLEGKESEKETSESHDENQNLKKGTGGNHSDVNANDSEPYPVSRQFWKMFEKTVKAAPAYWLWSHKRWKKI